MKFIQTLKGFYETMTKNLNTGHMITTNLDCGLAFDYMKSLDSEGLATLESHLEYMLAITKHLQVIEYHDQTPYLYATRNEYMSYDCVGYKVGEDHFHVVFLIGEIRDVVLIIKPGDLIAVDRKVSMTPYVRPNARA